LKLYFQAHQITVLTDKPLWQILHKLDMSRKLVKWMIELGESGVFYTSKDQLLKDIKGQALTNFIVECSFGNMD